MFLLELVVKETADSWEQSDWNEETDEFAYDLEVNSVVQGFFFEYLLVAYLMQIFNEKHAVFIIEVISEIILLGCITTFNISIILFIQ